MSGAASRTCSANAAAANNPPRSPSAATPLRRTGSVRRTSHVDIVAEAEDTEPNGSGGSRFGPHPLLISGAARDLATIGSTTEHETLGEVRLRAQLRADRALTTLSAAPELPELSGLLGEHVGPGFRASVDAVLGERRTTPVGLVLDDLPTAALISGYASLRRLGHAGVPTGDIVPPSVLPLMADLCSGWRSDGEMVLSIDAGQGVPIQDCPPAPTLEDPGDPDGWHPIPPLAPGAMRRRRRIDLTMVTDEIVVDAMFRDSYCEPDGTEVVLHEYELAAWLEPVDLRVLEIGAVPLVLPFQECPFAADNVARLMGTPLRGLRAAVREQLTGVAGCTHLNDLVAALGDLWPLAAGLGGADR
jgi:hypothetical protein